MNVKLVVVCAECFVDFDHNCDRKINKLVCRCNCMDMNEKDKRCRKARVRVVAVGDVQCRVYSRWVTDCNDCSFDTSENGDESIEYDIYPIGISTIVETYNM